MDEERTVLTTPVSSKNSVLKMIKRQIAKEGKAGHSWDNPGGTQGQRVLAQDMAITAQPDFIESQDYSATGTGARPKRRVTREDIELSEIRHRDKKRQVKFSPDEIHPPENISSYENQHGNRSNWRKYGSVNTPSETPGDVKTNQSGTPAMVTDKVSNVTDKVSSITDNKLYTPDQSSGHEDNTVQVSRSNEPWTINTESYFVYGPSFRAGSSRTVSQPRSLSKWWADMWSPYGGFHRLTSGWIYAALALLLVANVVYMTAFCTSNWGILHILSTGEETEVKIQTETVGYVTPPTIATRTNETSVLKWLKEAWNDLTHDAPEKLGYESPVSGDSTTIPTGVKDHVGGQTKPIHVVNMMHRPKEKPKEFWSFGLWRCCRNTDGLCLGIRWAAFYGATRAFAVLSLFGMVLSFAWMLGHTLEKLLDYDVCTMSSLISLCYATTIFTVITVSCFGIRWPRDFRNEFDGTDPRLSYSFFLAILTIPLTLAAATCMTIDLKNEVNKAKARDEFYTETELNDLDPISDLPTDNIARPRYQKKKRRGIPLTKYAPTGSSNA